MARRKESCLPGVPCSMFYAPRSTSRVLAFRVQCSFPSSRIRFQCLRVRSVSWYSSPFYWTELQFGASDGPTSPNPVRALRDLQGLPDRSKRQYQQHHVVVVLFTSTNSLAATEQLGRDTRDENKSTTATAVAKARYMAPGIGIKAPVPRTRTGWTLPLSPHVTTPQANTYRLLNMPQTQSEM